MVAHNIDMELIPKTLRSLDWKEMRSDLEWGDGTLLLVAQPETYESGEIAFYDLHLVLWCGAELDDDGNFIEFEAVHTNGEETDFDIHDCDLYVVIESLLRTDEIPPF